MRRLAPERRDGTLGAAHAREGRQPVASGLGRPWVPSRLRARSADISPPPRRRGRHSPLQPQPPGAGAPRPPCCPTPRRARARAAVALLAAALFLGAGCGARPWGPRTLTVTMTPEFAFEPREVVVRPGETVRLVLVNADDRLPHEFRSGGRLGPDLRLAPGERRAWEWTAPQEPGAIVFWCGMPGHRKNGMVGRIVIRASP